MMGTHAQQVLADKAARKAARDALDTRLARMKADLETRGLAGRIADEVSERARVVIDEAVDVAEAHPGVIGGTIAALALWLLRHPLIALIAYLFDRAGTEEQDDGDGNE
ncbi:hypothetical protein [Novosphingobium album (ex Liu et al. 2023)]|uniref:DUF3618 domain-containing protein n=1 Tax=Novosphingobium album (ex Liu et al. 2023) TaxID=3031130 RepID=A0ABT5WUP5_9SPHN|nr:hypothetical protein [Novosphingobium album (ex Liu et al. 2023)]MDE8653628.1 hypothetical protein [Novosphingobium album (ex Liu et al. 2023)]